MHYHKMEKMLNNNISEFGSPTIENIDHLILDILPAILDKKQRETRCVI
jgi:hypothetical protein